MKRSLVILCALAILVCCLISLSGNASATEETVCQYCGRAENQWIELTNELDRFLVAGHYYLAGTVYRDKQLILETTEASCVDLRGQALTGAGRAFQVGEDSQKLASVLNIIDTVGGGTIWGKGSTNASWSGGSLYIEPGATVNLYGGTLTTYNVTTQSAGKGAVAAVNGTLNVYGGTAPVGSCAYVHSSAAVTLSGDTTVEKPAFMGSAADCLTVSGVYTGTAELVLSETVTSGTTIGVSDGADIGGATLTVADSDWVPIVSGSSIILGEGSWCEACKRNVIWQNLSAVLPSAASGHYCLTTDVNISQVTLKNNSTVCLDLAGHTYASTGRAFIIGTSNGDYTDVLNIMDSSEEQSGLLTGRGGDPTKMAGGVIYNYKNTTVNIYSGTLQAIGSDTVAKNGGILDTYGTINMYGGKLIGNRVSNFGGTVCLLSSTAVFNMEGGIAVSGAADVLGNCVYVASGATVKLSGDAAPAQIYFAGSSASKLTVSENYTGKTELKFATTPAAGGDIGNCDNAIIGEESISIADTRLYASVSGSNLVAAALSGAAVTDTEGNVSYFDTLSAAAAAYTNGGVIRLLADNAETLTISGNAILDLSGWDAAGAITVSDGTLSLKDSATDAATAIYGCPYILFSDGTCFYGNICVTSLQKLTEAVDTRANSLTLTQNRALLAMYDTYKTQMNSWKLTNIKTSVANAANAADDGVFKAMIIGNSDSTDATNLLYEIFLAEGWTKDQLVLGCMYESGCSITDQLKFAVNNSPAYKYYKNTGANADGTWDCTESATLQQALEDENWDVIILQESNTVSGLAETFQNDDIENLITYVVHTLGYEPKLLWHFVGANPEIPQAYVDYVMSLEGDDGGGSDAGENESWEDTGVSEPEDLAWIFDIARPGYPVSWAKRYIENWDNDREVMYNAISANVQAYIMGSELYGFDGVIPSATTFQYAINTLGMTEQDMYRDYTHKSDYGRVMVSYLWYVTLTGQTEPLTEINFTTVPAAIRHKKFVQYGDLVLTDEQIDILIQSVNHAMTSPYAAPFPEATE